MTRRAYNALWESIVEARTLVLHNVADAYEDVANRISAYAEALGRQVERMSAENAVNEAAAEMDDTWGVAIRHMRRDVNDIYRTIQEAARDHREDDGGTARQAVQEALDAFAERGITEFRDKAGRRWGLPEYADMFVRTNIQRAGLRATIETMDRYGWDRCFVNSHMGCCEACEDWQGVVMSLRGMTPGIPTLQEAMDAGLFHPNCAHQLQVYLPGLSEPGHGVPEGYTREANDDLYARRQKQRYIERKIREWKKKQAAATTPERERECFERVKLWQKRARENTGGANVRRFDREGGRVRLKLTREKLKPTTAGQRSRLTDALNSGIMVSDSGRSRRRITQESIDSVPIFTEFNSPEANEAVHKACVELLSDLVQRRVGTEELMVLPLSKLNEYLRNELPMNGLKNQGAGSVMKIDIEEPYYAIHNHPSNETFSLLDVCALCTRSNCVGVVVIGNNGSNAYSMLRTDTFDKVGFFDFIKKATEREIKYRSKDELFRMAQRYGVKYTSRTY